MRRLYFVWLCVCSALLLSACGDDVLYESRKGSDKESDASRSSLDLPFEIGEDSNAIQSGGRDSSSSGGNSSGDSSGTGGSRTGTEGSSSGGSAGGSSDAGTDGSSSGGSAGGSGSGTGAGDSGEGSSSHSGDGTQGSMITPGTGDATVGLLTEYDGGRWSNQMIITGTPGRLACLSVTDTDVLPYGAGFQYTVVLVSNSERPGQKGAGYCPVGEYVIEERSSCWTWRGSNVPAHHSSLERCAGFISWNEQGTIEEKFDARSGLVLVNETAKGCEVELELHFAQIPSLFGSYLIPDTSEEVSCGASL